MPSIFNKNYLKTSHSFLSKFYDYRTFNLQFRFYIKKKDAFLKFDWNGQVGSVDEDESKKNYKRTDKQKERKMQ